MQSTGAISFTIPGRLRGKGRPRFARVGKFVRTFTDEKTVSHEAMIRQYASEAMRGRAMMEGPVSLHVRAFFHTPASWSKKRKAAALYVTGKPDCDNSAKCLGDAMNSIVFRDDSQIADLRYVRFYEDTTPERVEITITELAGRDAAEKPPRTQAYQSELDASTLFGRSAA